MSRWTSSANETEAAQTSIVLVTMVDLDFASGHVYAHDGIGTIPFGGHDYLGVGQYGGINIVNEAIDVTAKPVILTLSGVDPSLVSTAMFDNNQGRQVVIYIALFNKDTRQLIDTPEAVWVGLMDWPKIDIDQNSATITLNCESRLRQSPRISLQTDQDQQIAFPGDTFYNQITNIANYRSNWGAAVPQNYGTGGSPSLPGYYKPT
jgi:hypothetical protein